MSHCVSRLAVLILSMGLLPAWAQQSPSQASTNTTTTFVPATPMYQGNATHGQETAAPAQMEPSVTAGQSAISPMMPPLPSSPPAPNAGPGTAVEQGYDPNALDARMAALRAADEAANDNPRQRGEHLGIPSYRDTVARNPADAEWLFNWKQKLVDVGVHPAKVDFEAGRLPHDEFAMWASRMVWALEDQRPRPPRPPHARPAPAPTSTCCQSAALSPCCR